MPEKWEKSRIEVVRSSDIDIDIEMPDIGDYSSVIQYLEEIGIFNQGAAGATPLTWTDIKDWMYVTNRKLSPMLSDIIIHLSRVYCGQIRLSTKDIPAPFGGEEATIFVKQVALGNKTRRALKDRNG